MKDLLILTVESNNTCNTVDNARQPLGFINLRKLFKKILLLTWNIEVVVWLTAANYKVTKKSRLLAFEARKKLRSMGASFDLQLQQIFTLKS